MGKRVIVTGASGFIGANLARRLLKKGHALHLLLRSGYATWRIEELKGEAQFVVINFADPHAMRRALRQIKPDWIFHLTTYGAYAFQSDLQTMVHTNVNGTVNLVEAAIETGFEVLVNTGSSSEYGFKGYPAMEDDSLDPNSIYAVTKAASTLFCRHMARSRNLSIPTLRLYSVYGPYEDPSRFIPTLVRNGFAGRLPALASPHIVRDFVHVDDVCEGFMAAATRRLHDPGAVINLGTGIQTRLDEVVSIVRELLGVQEEPHWGTMPARSWDTDTWVADITKAGLTLKWRAAIDLRNGLKRTIDWYRNNPSRLDPAKSTLPGKAIASSGREKS